MDALEEIEFRRQPELEVIHLLLMYPKLVEQCVLVPEDFEFFDVQFEEIKTKYARQEHIGLSSGFSFPVTAFLLTDDYVSPQPTAFAQLCVRVRNFRILRDIKAIDDLDEIEKILQLRISGNKIKPLLEISQQFYEEYAERQERIQEGYIGIKTGFSFLDQEVIFDNGQLITIAARPGRGKTCFSFTLALNMAKYGKKVLFLALEMQVMDMVERAISSTQNIPLKDLITCKDENVGKHLDALITQYGNLSIHHPRRCSMADIAFYAKNFDIVFVDQLSNIAQDQAKGETKAMMYGRFTSGLNRIAIEQNIPLFLCCQINREGVDNPTLETLKDSGSIEEDSHKVLLLHCKEENSREMHVLVGKNRKGKENIGKMFIFDRDFTRVKEF